MEYGISFPLQGNKNPPNRKSSLRDHERPVSQTAKSARDSRAGNEGMSTGSLYSDVLLRTAKGTRNTKDSLGLRAPFSRRSAPF